MSKKNPQPTPIDVKELNVPDFMRAAMSMPDAESLSELVREYAAHSELDEGYVRWFIVSWVEKNQADQADRMREILLPQEHAAELKRREKLKARSQSPQPK